MNIYGLVHAYEYVKLNGKICVYKFMFRCIIFCLRLLIYNHKLQIDLYIYFDFDL